MPLGRDVPILRVGIDGRFHAAGSASAPSALGGAAGHLLFTVSYFYPVPPLNLRPYAHSGRSAQFPEFDFL